MNNRKTEWMCNLPQQKIDRIYRTQQRIDLEKSLPLKDRIKFCSINILSFMERVVQKHTKYYRSDFEIDKKMLWKSMEQEEAQGQTFLWMCRTAGTWLLPEQNVLLKGTSENNTFNFYMEQSADVVLVFAVRVTNIVKGVLMGDVYVLDYSKHYAHVGDVALHPETVLLQYEHGSCIKKADFAVKYHVDPEYGKLLSIQYQPNSEKELAKLLQKEQQERDKFQERNPSTYLRNFNVDAVNEAK